MVIHLIIAYDSIISMFRSEQPELPKILTTPKLGPVILQDISFAYPRSVALVIPKVLQ